jgi:hypothetical protein
VNGETASGEEELKNTQQQTTSLNTQQQTTSLQHTTNTAANKPDHHANQRSAHPIQAGEVQRSNGMAQ